MSDAIPSELRYSEDHEWVRDEGDTVTIGITDFAQDQLGDVVFVDLPETGSQLTRGASFGEVESTKSVSDLYAPVDGEVVAVNEALSDAPELVNSDPYGEGWMCQLRPSDRSQLDALLDADAYRAQLGE
ncbi:MAG: glycine cleavage system protein GcvH [Nitriliruptoraceae bacterium]